MKRALAALVLVVAVSACRPIPMGKPVPKSPPQTQQCKRIPNSPSFDNFNGVVYRTPADVKPIGYQLEKYGPIYPRPDCFWPREWKR